MQPKQSFLDGSDDLSEISLDSPASVPKQSFLDGSDDLPEISLDSPASVEKHGGETMYINSMDRTL